MARGKVFNTMRRPKLLRKRISAGEMWTGAVLLIAIVGMTAWLVAQRDAYDPAERDISMAVLEAGSVVDDLYKAPLRRWREPGAAGAGEADPVDLGPLPTSLLRAGWTSPASPQTFTPETLYEKINGQAEQYLRFGFRELVVVPLEHPQEGLGLDVFLYDQGSFANSLGVYEEQRGEKAVHVLGNVSYTPHELGALGTCGRLFFHVTGTRPGPALDAQTQKVLEAIGTLAEPGEIPEAYRVFAGVLEIPFSRIGYEPQNVFQLRFATDFWFGQPDPEGDARYFVHVADSPEAAEEMFGRLHQAQLEEYEEVEAADRAALYRHPFLKTYFALHVDGPYVFGLDGHPDRDAVAPAVARLHEALLPAREEGDR